MLTNVVELIALIVSVIACIISFVFVKIKATKGQIRTAWMMVYICMIIMCSGMIGQITLSELLNIPPIYFEYITYIGNGFLSVAVFFAVITFINTKITFKKKYLLLFVIPIISLIVLWTNDLHHLFYIEYSIYPSQTIYGNFLYIYNAYTIALLLISIVYLLRYSVKNSGIFSKQAIMIIIAAAIPIFINVISTFRIMELTIYITPISFAITIILLTFAIFKFKFLKITPVALQKIVDRISDGYLVLNEENVITDFNKTYLEIFGMKAEKVRNKNIVEYLEENNINSEKYKNAFEKIKNSEETVKFEQRISGLNKYFSVEINTIFQNKEFLGKLVLFKDITQHKQDMQTIKRNQDIIVERERLATLGQMIGGIAHNLKTPIMSISGATQGITDLIKEYELSIDNPQVNSEDHHAIAKEMLDWAEKIKSYLEYMSDVITAVKGQAVNLSDEQQDTFTITNLVKHVNILMKHELKNAIVYLNTDVKCDKDTKIKGNMNSLVQVIDNMISNAVQAYAGEPEQNIDMTITKSGKKIIISIKDYGPGLPEKVQEKLFKEMITTKGKNGTGLGLYMSYSNIRAHFNGDITVETKKGEGTTFNIILPAYS
jgi:PAS domain S-box-containing protein